MTVFLNGEFLPLAEAHISPLDRGFLFGDGVYEVIPAYAGKLFRIEQHLDRLQNSLDGYVEGPDDRIFSYWALNDVATSLFIQGEAYRKAEKMDEAKEAYKKIVNKFMYGQAWDTQGWFWKPAEAAKEKIAMLETGSTLDFGDYSSSYLTAQAWKALGDNDVDGVAVYVDEVQKRYNNQAKEMQESLTEYPWESKEKIFEYWALNDVGTSLYIKGESLKREGKGKEAKEAYQKLVDEYYFAQCWDPKGWFWKPAEAAQQALDELGEI